MPSLHVRRVEASLQSLRQGVEIRQDAVGQIMPLDDIARAARYVERELEEYHSFMSSCVYESLKVDKDLLKFD